MTDYVVRSVRGRPIASFQHLERAREFRDERAAKGVPVRIWRVTIGEEEVK